LGDAQGLGEFASPWRDSADRAAEREAKRAAVLRVAAEMFVARGYGQTKLADVASRLKTTKAALYTYFESKEAILVECYRLGDLAVREGVASAETTSGSGLEKVQRFIRCYCEVMTTTFGKCLNRIDDRELSPGARELVRGYKRDVDQLVRRLIALGVEDGSIRPCDVRIATFLVEGAINWIGFWYDPNGPSGPAEIGERFVALLSDGLAVQKRN
jgi:AcrR family transcriptional regulator